MASPIINGKAELVDVETLEPHPRNPRQGDVGAIATSILHNGFYGVCVVQQSTRYVLVGNHRREAVRALDAELVAHDAGQHAEPVALCAACQGKWTEPIAKVPVLWVDVDEATATRILLADNRTNDLAHYDEFALADLLTDIVQGDPLGLIGTGYENDDVDSLIATINPPDLSDVAERLGPPRDGEAFTAFRLVLPAPVATRLRGALNDAGGDSDAERVTTLLDRLDA